MEEVKPRITSIALTGEGIEFGYMFVPRDVRKNGLVFTRSVVVPFGSDYEDEIEAFVEAAEALLLDALDDEDRAEPIDLEEEEETDDDDAEE